MRQPPALARQLDGDARRPAGRDPRAGGVTPFTGRPSGGPVTPPMPSGAVVRLRCMTCDASFRGVRPAPELQLRGRRVSGRGTPGFCDVGATVSTTSQPAAGSWTCSAAASSRVDTGPERDQLHRARRARDEVGLVALTARPRRARRRRRRRSRARCAGQRSGRRGPLARQPTSPPRRDAARAAQLRAPRRGRARSAR